MSRKKPEKGRLKKKLMKFGGEDMGTRGEDANMVRVIGRTQGKDTNDRSFGI